MANEQAGSGTANAGGTNAAGAASGSSTSSQGDGGGDSNRARTATERAAAAEGLSDRMIARYGTADRALGILAEENWERREANRELSEANARLRKNQPPDGAIVLVGDDAKAWEKIKAQAADSKLALDKVAERIKRADALEAEQQKAAREKSRADVARVAKLDPDVLPPLLDQFGLDVETRVVKIQGTDGKLTDGADAFVRKAGDANATWEKLADFIKRDGSPLKPFEIALRQKAGQGAQQGGGNGSGATSAGGGASHGEAATVHAFPNVASDDVMGVDGGMMGDDYIAKRIESRNKAAAARANPLAPPTAPTTAAK